MIQSLSIKNCREVPKSTCVAILVKSYSPLFTMRAGPLSSPKIVKLLNAQYVNLWVLLREFPELQAGAKGAAAAALATKLQEHFVYPVDTLILTPGLEFIQHLPMNEFIRSNLPSRERRSRYFTWLKSSLNNGESGLTPLRAQRRDAHPI